MKNRIILCLLALAVTLCGCGKTAEPETSTGSVKPETSTGSVEPEISTDSTDSFTVTSDSLHADGAWDTAIANDIAEGQNLSPQLRWEAYSGAACYAVYMIDTTAGNWLHWKASDLTVTELSEGENSGEYMGPYPPPSSTHTYVVYVFALVATPDSYPGDFDTMNESIETIMDALDVNGGQTGNLLSWCSVSGTYVWG